jgi:serine/threonine protein kinase/tetratricopeptide (TPR) repeat protein
MSTRVPREKAVFVEALEIADPEQRRQFLDQACGADPAFREQVEKLLALSQTAGDFFKDCAPALEPAAADAAQVLSAAESAVEAEIPETKCIGPYKLLQKLGEGGYGVVYMAEQQQPIRRRVALKIIKLGMDTRNVIARFEAERQALALMDHPNIARVLDAGATETGRPYFVMELVYGVKITEYCDQNRVSMKERLELFIQVCNAVQHAHQKGIIHRDLKPSNIMVTMHDGVPVPKVIDFGIAKATERRLTNKTLFTSYAQLMGTPAYMSPEQMELSGLNLDTRSDIYSLGVLLYELLTGRTPFDTRDLLKLGVEELRRTVCEREPPSPSAKLRTLANDEITKTARLRRIEPPRLVAQLHGDLDWIVLKCLEKDRTRRYATANALAMDAERYLHQQPVLARPPSRIYHFQKLVHRNRVVFASLTAAAFALIACCGTSTWLFLLERQARREAVRGRANEALLRQQAEARAAIGQAAALVGENQFGAADQLMARVSFPEHGLGGESVFRPLGEWAAAQGLWPRAAAYFKLLCWVDQMETPNVATLDGTRCAVALVQAGDEPGYDKFRRDLIERFASTRYPVEAERTVKNSLLLPADKTVMAALEPLAALATKAVPMGTPTPQEEPWPGATAWRCDSLALWSYRQANYAAALEWCRRCLSYGDNDAARVATADALMAMAYGKLGQVQDATYALALSRNLADENGGRGYWFDWALDRILMAEAAALIEKQTPPSSTPVVSKEREAVQRRQAEARDIMAKAASLVSKSQMAQADRLIGTIPVSAETATLGTTVFRALGDWTAVQGNWRRAAEYYSALLPLDRFETPLLATQDYIKYAVVLAEMNDRQAYENFCLEYIKQFQGTGNAELAERIVKSCSLLPPSPGLLAGLSPLAEMTVDSVRTQTDPNHWALPWQCMSLALVEYRRGNYAASVNWGNRGLSFKQNAQMERVAATQAILAMAYQQLGQAEPARSALAKSRELVEERWKTPLVVNGHRRGFWYDWLLARLLEREAAAKIELSAPAR